MSNNACHMSPEMFETPEKFMPMRWINNDDSTIQLMSANLHPYGRGPRKCLGEKYVTYFLWGMINKVTIFLQSRTHRHTSFNCRNTEEEQPNNRWSG